MADSMIKLAEANRGIIAAQKYARDHGYSISVTTCDSMGHLIARQRMDDALPLSSYGSVGKAIASAGLGIPSGEESDVDLDRSSVSGVLAHGLAVIRRPGGLPIKRRGEVEGAIGVSGAPTDTQDEECARRGIETIGSRARCQSNQMRLNPQHSLRVPRLRPRWKFSSNRIFEPSG